MVTIYLTTVCSHSALVKRTCLSCFAALGTWLLEFSARISERQVWLIVVGLKLKCLVILVELLSFLNQRVPDHHVYSW